MKGVIVEENMLEKEVPATYDMQATKNEIVAQVDQKEIMALTDQINLGDVQTIVTFGKDAATEIAKCSDQVLNGVTLDQLSAVGNQLSSLGKIMDKLDMNELTEPEKKGFLSKVFNNAQKQLEKFMNKYTTVGDEIDKVYVELKQYEKEIGVNNDKLETLFNTNVDYYKLLSKYILAGEEGLRQVDAYKAQLESKYTETGDQSIQFAIQNVDQGRMVLEQRVQDLRIAENVAMQSIPMIKAMQFSNVNLVRKINSAFIITLPVFKQAVAQAVMLKRQKIQADALAALDERTNAMLIQNAQNTVNQSKQIMQLASGSSIKMETLEQTWNTILNGIEETKQLQEDITNKRIADCEKLKEMKATYTEKVLAIESK